MKQIISIIILYVISIPMAVNNNVDISKLFLFLAVGIVFEIITREMWIYNMQILLTTLGWVGCLMVSNVMQIIIVDYMPVYLSYIVSFMLIGSLCEAIFLKLKCWKYNYEGIVFGVQPLQWKISQVQIFGVPLSIILGYGLIFGNICYLFDLI